MASCSLIFRRTALRCRQGVQFSVLSFFLSYKESSAKKGICQEEFPRGLCMESHFDFRLSGNAYDNERNLRSGTMQMVKYAIERHRQLIYIYPDTANAADFFQI